MSSLCFFFIFIKYKYNQKHYYKDPSLRELYFKGIHMSDYSDLIEKITNELQELKNERNYLESSYDQETKEFERMKRADFLMGGVITSLLFLVISILIEIIDMLIPEEFKITIYVIIVSIALGIIIPILFTIYKPIRSLKSNLKKQQNKELDFIEIQTTKLVRQYDARLQKIYFETNKQIASASSFSEEIKGELNRTFLEEKELTDKVFSDLIAQLEPTSKFSLILYEKMDKIERKYFSMAIEYSIFLNNYRKALKKSDPDEIAKVTNQFLDQVLGKYMRKNR